MLVFFLYTPPFANRNLLDAPPLTTSFPGYVNALHSLNYYLRFKQLRPNNIIMYFSGMWIPLRGKGCFGFACPYMGYGVYRVEYDSFVYLTLHTEWNPTTL